MSKSTIEWTDSTWNPTTGCDKVSRGCDRCYAMIMSNRLQSIAHSSEKYAGTVHKVGERGKIAWTGKINLSEKDLSYPFTLRKAQKIFVNSMSDLFHKDVPFDFVDRVFAVMALTPHLTYQICTKRPERMAEYFAVNVHDLIGRWLNAVIKMGKPSLEELKFPLPNVWLGTSVENQKVADERIPQLLRCPAAVRFLSCEPLVGAVDLGFDMLHCPKCHYEGPWFNDGFNIMCACNIDYRELTHRNKLIHWVIAGGESGPGAAPSHPDWFRSLRDQCEAAGVPFFFKQWGAYSPQLTGPYHGMEWIAKSGDLWTGDDRPLEDYTAMYKVGKSVSGALLDGIEHKAFPKSYKTVE